MKDLKMWQKIVDIFYFLNVSKQDFLSDGLFEADKIIDFRGKLRLKLDDLKVAVESRFGKKTSYYIIFPLVVYCDEFMNKLISESNSLWPKLQKELYDLENGGTLFYEYLDTILEQPIFPELVYQVFYLIMKSDFDGMLADENSRQTKLNYLSKLEELLKVAGSGNEFIHEKYTTVLNKLTFRNWARKYYSVFVLLGVAVCYAAGMLIFVLT